MHNIPNVLGMLLMCCQPRSLLERAAAALGDNYNHFSIINLPATNSDMALDKGSHYNVYLWQFDYNPASFLKGAP